MNSIEPISIYDTRRIDWLRAAARFDPQAISSLRSKLLRKFVSDEAALAGLPMGDQLCLHVFKNGPDTCVVEGEQYLLSLARFFPMIKGGTYPAD